MTAGHFTSEIQPKRSPLLFIFTGSLAQISIDFVGKIFFAELFMYVVWCFIWVSRKKQIEVSKRSFVSNSYLVTFQKLMIGAFVAQFITDLIRGANFLDMVKGSALILFTLFNLIVILTLTMLYSGVVQNMLLGYGLSYFVSAIIQPNEYFQSYPWKFGFAYGTTLLLFIFLQRYFLHNYFVIACIILIYTALNLALDTRSLALVSLIAGANYLLVVLLKRAKWMTLAILILSFVLAPSLYSLYASEASKGTFGLNVQQKFLDQTINTKNIFYGGRTDVYVGLSQVIDSPIFGQGSYAKISSSNRQEIITEVVRTNPNSYPLLFTFKEGKLIPIHSVILQFWVWYGIIGALPWLWYLYTIIWTLWVNIKAGKRIGLVHSYILTLAAWDILFSPFGADRRFMLPLTLIALLKTNFDSKV